MNELAELNYDHSHEMAHEKVKIMAQHDMIEVRLQVERACRQVAIGKTVAFGEIVEHAMEDEAVRAYLLRLLTGADGDPYSETKALKKHLYELALSTAFYQVVDSLEFDWVTWENLRDTHAER